MAWETEVKSQIESYQRLKRWYLRLPCVTLSIIRWLSRVKWSNPGKGVVLSHIPWCSSYWKGVFGLPSTIIAHFTLYIMEIVFLFNWCYDFPYLPVTFSMILFLFKSKFFWKMFCINTIGFLYILITWNCICIYNSIVVYRMNRKANLPIDHKNLILINICLVLLISLSFIFINGSKNPIDKS